MKFAGIAARSPIGKFFSLSQSSDAHRPEAAQPIDPTKTTTAGASDSRWLWRGYVFILAFLALRLWYAASGFIELSEDEAYQWLWSKHLALSYYSKPPMIAYTQFLATSIWGDTEFGIRFFSPVIAAIVMFLMLRFLAREGFARAGFWLAVIFTVTPLMAVGATLMTIDPLSCLFWTAAFICSWRAIHKDCLRSWCLAGVWLGFGFFSKYTALFQLLSWVLFFLLWPPARKQLRRAGPYAALGIASLFTIPVLIWNHQHGWITVTHLAERGGLDQRWEPTLRFLLEFTGGEFGLLHPIFFVGMIWAAIAFWRSEKNRPLLLYLFSMGAPIFIFYFLFSIRSRVLPNWIAPAIVPLFALMVVYFDQRWRDGQRWVKSLLIVSLVLGGIATLFMQAPGIVPAITGRPLPPRSDPLRRVTKWSEMARLAGEERTKLLAEGKPVFFICDHYGTTSLLTFYLPEAKQGVPDHPLVYAWPLAAPENQFYFWPGYKNRKGENALFVRQGTEPQAAPEFLGKDFESVTDLGMRDVYYHGQVYRRIQIFACRNLR